MTREGAATEPEQSEDLERARDRAPASSSLGLVARGRSSSLDPRPRTIPRAAAPGPDSPSTAGGPHARPSILPRELAPGQAPENRAWRGERRGEEIDRGPDTPSLLPEGSARPCRPDVSGPTSLPQELEGRPGPATRRASPLSPSSASSRTVEQSSRRAVEQASREEGEREQNLPDDRSSSWTFRSRSRSRTGVADRAQEAPLVGLVHALEQASDQPRVHDRERHGL